MLAKKKSSKLLNVEKATLLEQAKQKLALREERNLGSKAIGLFFLDVPKPHVDHLAHASR